MFSDYLHSLIAKEYVRQQKSLELIASENYVSNDVLSAYANIFTNKYSEGYPGKRYYGGNEVVDELERYTQKLALKIFDLDTGEWWVNVQPLSWSIANLAVYTGLLEQNDTVLAMDLSAGGHLTHGMKLNASGKYFNFISYGVDAQWYIDYDNLKQLALQHKPKLILAGFSSYPRNIDWKKFVQLKRELEMNHNHKTYLMADIAHIAGLIAGNVINSPFQAGFDIITTTTHKTLRWPRWALIYYHKINLGDIEKSINKWVFPGVQWWPFDHVLVAKAVSFEEILDPATDRHWYCKQVLINSTALAQSLVGLWRELATWGTDNHLLVLDATSNWGTATWITGRIGEKMLEIIGLSTNKQLLPNDTRPPLDPSGIRLWTPAITTRWLKEEDVKLLGQIIHNCLLNLQEKEVLKNQVLQLCSKYPLWYKL